VGRCGVVASSTRCEVQGVADTRRMTARSSRLLCNRQYTEGWLPGTSRCTGVGGRRRCLGGRTRRGVLQRHGALSEGCTAAAATLSTWFLARQRWACSNDSLLQLMGGRRGAHPSHCAGMQAVSSMQAVSRLEATIWVLTARCCSLEECGLRTHKQPAWPAHSASRADISRASLLVNHPSAAPITST